MGAASAHHNEAPPFCAAVGLRFALIVETVNIEFLVEFVKVNFDFLIPQFVVGITNERSGFVGVSSSVTRPQLNA